MSHAEDAMSAYLSQQAAEPHPTEGAMTDDEKTYREEQKK